MHFSFSAVNENADKNEIPFSAEKTKTIESHLPTSQNGSVANVTYSAQRK